MKKERHGIYRWLFLSALHTSDLDWETMLTHFAGRFLSPYSFAMLPLSTEQTNWCAFVSCDSV